MNKDSEKCPPLPQKIFKFTWCPVEQFSLSGFKHIFVKIWDVARAHILLAPQYCIDMDLNILSFGTICGYEAIDHTTVYHNIGTYAGYF